MRIYVVYVHNYNDEYVSFQKAFVNYEAALAYRNELAKNDDMREHWYLVEDVELCD